MDNQKLSRDWIAQKITTAEVDLLQERLMLKIAGTDNGSSFTYFPRLPTELRLQIWRYASRVERCLDIWVELRGHTSNHLPTSASRNFRYTSRSPIPSILHVSREARDVGLRFYTPAFGNSFMLHRTNGYKSIEIVHPPQIYVNFEIDIICPMGFRNWTREMHSHWFKKIDGIRQMAIDTETGTISTKYSIPPSVKTLFLYSLPTRHRNDLTFEERDLAAAISPRPRVRSSFVNIAFLDIDNKKLSFPRIAAEKEIFLNFKSMIHTAHSIDMYNRKVLREHDESYNWQNKMMGENMFKKISEKYRQERPLPVMKHKVITLNGTPFSTTLVSCLGSSKSLVQ